MNIYLYQNGKEVGPYTEDQLRDMVKSGAISQTENAWHEGLSEWKPLNKIISIASSGPAFPLPPSRQSNGDPHVDSRRPSGIKTVIVAVATLSVIIGSVYLFKFNMNQAPVIKQQVTFIGPSGAVTVKTLSKPGELTNRNAELAITKAFKGAENHVTRIHEIPMANAAEAEVTLAGFQWNDHGQIKHPYSGVALAEFQHFNTGWVLKNLHFQASDGSGSFDADQLVEEGTN
jgi:hypothetical protein